MMILIALNPNIKNMKLYKERDFGELIGINFIFFGKEIKTILKGLFIFVGPFIFIKVLLIGYFGFLPAEDIYTKIQHLGKAGNGNSFLIQFLEFFQNVMLYTFVGAYIKVFIENGLGNVNILDVWGKIRKFYWSYAGGLILSGIIIALGFVLLVVPGIYFLIVLYPLFAIIIIEEKGVGNSISRAFDLIKGEWWFTFGLALVLFILLFSLSAVLFLLVDGIFMFVPGGSISFVLSNIIEESFSVLITFLLALAPFFIYGRIVAKKENPELTTKTPRFRTMKQKIIRKNFPM
jgi:hypothetical protein